MSGTNAQRCPCTNAQRRRHSQLKYRYIIAQCTNPYTTYRQSALERYVSMIDLRKKDGYELRY